jgi:hypothetical protein
MSTIGYSETFITESRMNVKPVAKLRTWENQGFYSGFPALRYIAYRG